MEQKNEKNISEQTVWKCKICGHKYVGEEIPKDYVCPTCGHPSSDYEKVTG